MASDVEVLRRMSARARREVAEWDDPRVSPSPTALEARNRAQAEADALSAAISALEALERQGVIVATGPAREAQPKVEGRMGDEKLALERHLRESSSIMPARAAAQAFLDAECDRARASEAALSERVATLEKALRGTCLNSRLCWCGADEGLGERHADYCVEARGLLGVETPEEFRPRPVLALSSKSETP